MMTLHLIVLGLLAVIAGLTYHIYRLLGKQRQLHETTAKLREENMDALILVIDLREQLQHSTRTVKNGTTIMKAQTDIINQQKSQLQAQAHLLGVNDRILNSRSLKKND